MEPRPYYITEIGGLNSETRQYSRYITVLGDDVTYKYALPEGLTLAEGQRVVRIPREVLIKYLENRNG